MAKRKLIKVPVLDKARTRLASIKSIDESVDLGNGITAAEFEVQIDLLETKKEKYNKSLSTSDDYYNEFEAQEAIVKDWHERILNGVASKYGKNSSQYEMAGGVRKSERKKPTKKTKE